MFKSPDALRKYALALASQMRVDKFVEQSRILEHRANLPCTTGWEWLEELDEGIVRIRSLGQLTLDIEQKLEKISVATKSSDPYAGS